MTGQDAQIAELCERLQLLRLASEWPGIAQQAARPKRASPISWRRLSSARFLAKMNAAAPP